MNNRLPDATHFQHHDLNTGRVASVPLDYQQGRQTDTLAVALQSQREDAGIAWAAAMYMFVDLSHSGSGVALIALSAADNMCGGRIKEKAPLYSMAVAVAPRMERHIWKRIGELYLKTMLTDEGSSAALGDMPGDLPWVAGFAWPDTKALGQNGNAKLIEYARLAAAVVVNRCRQVHVADFNRIGPLKGGDE